MAPSVREENGIVIMALEGKMMGAPKDTTLVERIDDLIDRDKVNIVIDFCKVEWMNSRGLGICVACITSLQRQGGALKLACACTRIKELLEKCQMDSLIECYDSVDAAVESFA
jgi:anti-anti-sigma factor